MRGGHLLWARRQLFHRPNSAYGENLFEMTGATASSAQVVNAWAAESRNYDYSSNRCRGVCGHYTQIVWGGTKDVGCASFLMPAGWDEKARGKLRCRQRSYS